MNFEYNTIEDIRKVAMKETCCTGCGACVNACPADAIQLLPRNGHFLFPEINRSKCINCKACLNVCPIENMHCQTQPRGFPKTYGGYAKDEAMRRNSSSGGLFSVLAKYILRNGGYVCGAAFTTGCKLEHVIIHSEDQLAPLQGSKYLQSNPGYVYREIKRLLSQGELVLFVGTPCQVAAMKAIAGDVKENLITVDFFCHGVPPQTLFEQYVNESTNGNADFVTNIRFRNKKPNGWNNPSFSFDFQGKTFSNSFFYENPYGEAFSRNLISRRSCDNCRFAKIPRQGDLTIGDLWKIAEKSLKIIDDKGTSAIVINTTQGEGLIQKIKDELFFKKISQDELMCENNFTSHMYAHPNRTRFWRAMQVNASNVSVSQLMHDYLGKTDNIACLNFHYSLDNYGSVLTGWALQEKIAEIVGYPPNHIIFWDTFNCSGGPLDDWKNFIREHFSETEPCPSKWKLRQLNRHYQTFVVGPDVVWRNMGFHDDFYVFLFNFVDLSKNICSYAASFGLNKIRNLRRQDGSQSEPSDSDISERKRLMKRFTHVSVREDSGVQLCQQLFDVHAEHVLDAVLLLQASSYQRLIDESQLKTKSNYVAKYILTESSVDPKLRTALANDSNIVSLREGTDYANLFTSNDFTSQMCSIPDWLKLIAKSDFLISDSFHGTCFAIIFRKQFAVVNVNPISGNERLKSLFRMLGISESRFVNTLDEYQRARAEKIDYAVIEPKLQMWMERSEAFLRSALADNKPNEIRNWLQSVEMLAEAAQPPAKESLRNIGIRQVRRIAHTFKHYGILSDVMTQGCRQIYLLGFPFAKISYKNGRRRLAIFGVPLLSISC